MKLSIIIPVYNERATISSMLDSLHASLAKQNLTDYEIVITDDYSKDGTREHLETIHHPKMRLVKHDKNYGKGRALRTGFAHATGDVVIIQDADMEYDPMDYSKLLQPIFDGKADVVYGSRFAGGECHRVLYYWHSWGNSVLTWFSNILTDLNLTDMETCYKVFRKEVLDQILPDLTEDRFGFEPEVTALLANLAREKNYKIFEVGISYNGRTYDEGKKIGWKDGFRALWCILKFNDTGIARVLRYTFSGSLVALSQIISMIILISGFHLDATIGNAVSDITLLGHRVSALAVGTNIINLIGTEISLLVAFFLHTSFTWNNNGFIKKRHYFSACIKFHGASFFSQLVKIAVFFGLTQIGFHYIWSTIISIAVILVLNFTLYSKIFKKKSR